MIRELIILFEEKIVKIRSLIEQIDFSASKSSIIVKNILETWLEMLIRFPDKIVGFRFNDIAEFLSDEAEKLLEIYNANECSSNVKIYRDPNFNYIFYSVTIEKETYMLLYPYMLFRVSDHPDFINNFFEDFIKIKPSLGNFIDTMVKNDVIIREKVTLDDFNRIKGFLKVDFRSRRSIVSIERNPSVWNDHLKNKRVLNLYANVNLHALDLQKFKLILDRNSTLPTNLQHFVEGEIVGSTLKLFQICCRNDDKEVMEKFNELNKMHLVEESYYYINIHDVQLSEHGYPDWERDYSQVTKNQGLSYTRLDKSYAIQKRLSSGMIKYLQNVHIDGNPNQSDRASILGSSRRSLLKYFRTCFDKKMILAYPSLKRIGLDSYYQLIYERNKNFREELLERQFYISVTSSKDIERMLIYLPGYKIPELEKFIQSSEKTGDVRIVAAEELKRKDFRRNFSLDFMKVLRSSPNND